MELSLKGCQLQTQDNNFLKCHYVKAIITTECMRVRVLSYHHICNSHVAWGHFFCLMPGGRWCSVHFIPLTAKPGAKQERSEKLSVCCVLPAASELLYSTGLQTHPWVGIHSFVTGPSLEQTACNVITKRFPWVVFSRNASCLFSSRGSVTKTTPN